MSMGRQDPGNSAGQPTATAAALNAICGTEIVQRIESLHRAFLAILFISFVTFLTLFGRVPALRNTPIGLLYRLVYIRLPKLLFSVDQAVTNGEVFRAGQGVVSYLSGSHPLVLIFFLALLTGGAGLFLSAAWSRLIYSEKYCVTVVIVSTYLFVYLAASSRSSYITTNNHDRQMSYYPFDYNLYFPGQLCYTCKFDKPARSKHCSLCGTCVAKTDHHCAWLNNCVGRTNYRWFLTLLLSLGIMLVYGAMLCYKLLASNEALANPHGGDSEDRGLWRSMILFFSRWEKVLATENRIGAVGLLAAFTWPLPWGLLVYNLYLLWFGATVNESSKWLNLRDAIEDNRVWIAERKESRDLKTELLQPNKIESKTTWPKRSRRIVIRTKDGAPPRFDREQRSQLPFQVLEWRKCADLDEIDNVYDIGFLPSLSRMLFPAE